MKKKIIIAIAVIVILAAGGFFYMNHKVNSAVKDGKILNGVTCEGISVGGMTKAEAKKLIESHMKEIHKENITLYVDEEKTDVKIESLGKFLVFASSFCRFCRCFYQFMGVCRQTFFCFF